MKWGTTVLPVEFCTSTVTESREVEAWEEVNDGHVESERWGGEGQHRHHDGRRRRDQDGQPRGQAQVDPACGRGPERTAGATETAATMAAGYRSIR